MTSRAKSMQAIACFLLISIQVRSQPAIGLNKPHSDCEVSLSDQSTSTITWDGRCVDGKADGFGTLIFATSQGSLKYVGQLSLGNWTGTGTVFYRNGDALSATFENGVTHGPVLFLYSDGARYEGDWSGRPNGFGTMQYRNSSSYGGNWHHGLWEGKGVLIFPNGDRYAGDFAHGRLNGHGTYVKTDGSWFDGDWIEGSMTGFGESVAIDGRRFIGQVLNGLREGHGTLQNPNGDRYDGLWIQDEPTGQGTFTRKDGTSYSGIWENGCLNTDSGWVTIYPDKLRCSK